MRRLLSPARVLLPVLLAQLLLSALPCRAAVLYVNNQLGSDLLDGSVPEPGSGLSGPVRSINRAVRLADAGDIIVVANTGVVYLESIHLSGAENSGVPEAPFTIIGNGAVVDGSAPVPPLSWKRVGENVYRVTPYRKGSYQLLLGDQPIPVFPIPDSAAVLPAIPEGQWGEWRGSIYYHVPNYGDPALLPLRLAVHGTGLTLYAVRHVVIRDLTFRHFRLDGVNAHDLCVGIVLENVRGIGNGRAGATAAGSSEMVLRNCELRNNLQHSLLITETAEVQLVESQLDQPPTVRE